MGEQRGWITDRFGLSWQSVPAALEQMTRNPNKAPVARVLPAMMAS